MSPRLLPALALPLVLALAEAPKTAAPPETPAPPPSAAPTLIIDAPHGCRAQALPALASARAAASPGCSPLGPQSILVLPVHNPATPPPAAVTQSFLEAAFFGPVSLAGYWADASYGRATVTGRVLPWKPLPRAFACTETFPLLDEVLRLFDPEVDFRGFHRIVIVFPRPAACSWTGMALTSCISSSTADGPITFTPAWLNAGSITTHAKALQLAAHELGHTLGLQHAAARDHDTEPVGPIQAPGAVSDYGDPFSALGAWNTGHYDARQKLQLGWLDPAQVAVVESGGSWILEPLAAQQAGLKALMIRRASAPDAWFWLEFRQKIGLYDSALSAYAYNGLLVRYQDRWTGSKSELLDFTPATASFTDAALAKARSYTDPHAALTIKVNSVSSTAASVTVDFGAGLCTRTPPSLTLTPARATVAPGAALTLAASLTNNDSVSCPAALYSLTSLQSPGLPSQLLAPGQTAAFPVPVQAPATLGAFSIDLTARHDALTVKSRSTLTVQ